MGKIENVSTADLRATVADLDEGKEAMRLMVAILYKAGPSVPMIADWYGIRQDTIYAWLNRLEAEPIETAIRDDPRPGRPSKLTEEQRAILERALRRPPEACGLVGEEWTPSLARRFISDTIGVEYSRRHVRRLYDEVRPDGPADEPTV